MNVVFVQPSSRARVFIRSTKAASVPARCSATATAQSFAEPTAIALSISSNVSCSPGSSQICVPPIEQAYSLPVIMVSSVTSPRSSASIANSMVMIFVTDAGCSCSSAL